MARLILIRHGATAGNLERRYIGRTDEPLCGQGVAQAEALRGRFLADRLFVSPALRARQTAGIVFPDMAYTVVQDLRETDFGAFEGKSAAELSGDPAYQAWVDSWCRGPIPGGECVADFKARCLPAFVRAAETLAPDTCGAFVVHGGVIMAVLEGLARPQRDFYDYHIPPGGFVVCRYQNGLLYLE